MGKVLHKLFKSVVNELNNVLPVIVESVSEVSHFIPEPSNFVEVAILPADFKKDCLKATLKYIKIVINNHKFLMDYPYNGKPMTPFMDIHKEKIQSDESIDRLKLRF